MLGFGKQFPTNTERWLYFTKHFFRNSIVTQGVIIKKTVKVIVTVRKMKKIIPSHHPFKEASFAFLYKTKSFVFKLTYKFKDCIPDEIVLYMLYKL